MADHMPVATTIYTLNSSTDILTHNQGAALQITEKPYDTKLSIVCDREAIICTMVWIYEYSVDLQSLSDQSFHCLSSELRSNLVICQSEYLFALLTTATLPRYNTNNDVDCT